MNIGITNSSGRYLFFLNAGDSIYNSGLFADFLRNIPLTENSNFSYAFSAIQKYQDLKWLRPSLHDSLFFLRPMLPPHQGLIVPHSHLTPFYSESLPLTADSDWIRQVLSIYPTLYCNEPLVIFTLGGLSNAPSMKLVSLRIKEASYTIAFIEILKYLLFSVISFRYYYRLIFLLRGLKFLSN